MYIHYKLDQVVNISILNKVYVDSNTSILVHTIKQDMSMQVFFYNCLNIKGKLQQ